MNYSDRFLISAPFEEVWAFAQDAQTLLSCIPNSSNVSVTGDGGVTVVFTDRVGPFQVEFHVNGTFHVDSAEHRVLSEGGGKDVKMGNTMNLKVSLAVQQVESGEVEVSVDADVNVLGKVATLGFGIMKDKARKTMIGFVQNVHQRLTNQVAP